VTGLGLVSPLASDVEGTWSRLIAGQSSARRIEKFATDDLATKIACMVPKGDGTNGTFHADAWVDPKEQRKVDEFIVFGIAAAQQAVTDSGWVPQTEEDKDRSGVMIGSGVGGLEGIAEAALLLAERGPRRSSPSKDWAASVPARMHASRGIESRAKITSGASMAASM